MKNQLFALIGLGLLLATASAYAQTGVVKANVPFNFIVNNTDLPAGRIHDAEYWHCRSAMTIESPDRKVVKAFLPNACESTTGAEDDQAGFPPLRIQYFLTQIWTAGNDRGKELPKSGREREVAMDYPSQDVVVVATLR